MVSEQILAAPLADVWRFFSCPDNLDSITPEDMRFEVTGNPAKEMYAGQILTYRIGILPLVKSSWITEITHVKNQEFFVDEQRIGPYALWHHEHHFIPQQDGTVLMRDIVSYKLPLGLIGALLAGRLVRNRIAKIFGFRYRIVERIFSGS